MNTRPRTRCRRPGGCAFSRYGWCEGCREETCWHWWAKPALAYTTTPIEGCVWCSALRPLD